MGTLTVNATNGQTVAAGASYTVSYPAGKSAADYLATGAKITTSDGSIYSATVSLGGSGITITNPTGRAIASGGFDYLDLDNAGIVARFNSLGEGDVLLGPKNTEARLVSSENNLLTGGLDILNPEDGTTVAVVGGATRVTPNTEILNPTFMGAAIAADYNADSFSGIADGGNITTWPDSSGNGNNLTTVSATNPTMKSGINGIGGKPAVRFVKASSTYLTGALTAKISTRYPVSVIAVLRGVVIAGTHKIVSVTAAGGSGGWSLSLANGAQSTYAGQTFASSVVFGNGTTSVIGFSLNKDWSHEHAANGNIALPGTSNQDMNGTPTIVTLGIHGNLSSDAADYDIARLIIFRSELTYPQMRAMQVYLAEQYGFSRSKYFGNDYQVPTTPLDIPTPNGLLECTHPDVIYGNGAGVAGSGYKYLMAFTPMPAAQENPSIVGSNDGDVWEVPSGVTNPLVPRPNGTDYNSDTDMHINEDGLLAIVFREFTVASNLETIKVIYSSDARAWTSAVTLMDSSGISVGEAGLKLLSPAVVYDGSEYKMWTVRTVSAVPLVRAVDLRRASTLAGLSSATVEATNLFNPAKGAGQEIWHLDVILHNGVYYAMTYIANTLELFVSVDGKSFTCARTNIAYTLGAGTFAASGLYRGTLQFDLNGDLTIWYGGTDTGVYRIGKFTLPKIHIPPVGGV